MTTKNCGLYLHCMDPKIDWDAVASVVRSQLGMEIQEHGGVSLNRYCYPLTSPGGNSPVEVPRSLRTLAEVAKASMSRLRVTHILFSDHDGCAAKAANHFIKPEVGAWAVTSIYRYLHENVYQNVFVVERPKLHVVHVNTHSSEVAHITDLPDSIWDRSRKLRKEADVRKLLHKFI